MAIVFVTHDVGVAVEVADRIAVMYAGRFVEVGPTEAVIDKPAHPYTAALLTSTVLGSAFGKRLDPIPGMPPDLRALPEGCSFAPRCRFSECRCRASMPPEFGLTPERMTRCLRVAGREIELTGPSLSERNTSGIERLGDALGASPPSQATMPLSCAADVYQSPRDRSRTDLGEP
jgi:oligopeptide/dipeptide ABC transporter ATP-binding protein